jgi:hypothetical protein
MLPISLLTLLTTALLLVILRLFNRRIAWHWLTALLGGVLGWVLVMLARFTLPQSHGLLSWEFPGIVFAALSLQLDAISWPFALAVVSMPVAVVLTALARRSPLYWRPWAGTLLMAALGLLAVCAGDPLTLLLTWVALDLFEMVILFAQGRQENLSRNMALTFAGRILGVGLVMLAMLAGQSAGQAWTLVGIPAAAAPYLLLAAGLRLGVLPFNAPFYFDEITIRRGLGSALRLIPAASGFVLLARTAVAGIPAVGWITPDFPLQAFFLSLAALSALVGAAAWATAQDEMTGRLFWLLAHGSLATAAAVLGLPVAALAWGSGCLFSGALLFLHSIRGRGVWLLPLLSALAFSGLPFTPGWHTVGLFQAGWPWRGLFVLAQALLLVGFVRHTLRAGQGFDPSQRWVKVLYVVALIFLLASQGVAGYALPWPAWSVTGLGGAAAVLIAAALGGLGLAAGRFGWRLPGGLRLAVQRVFALDWFYRLLEAAYRLIERLLAMLAFLLEGDGGLLWVFILIGMLVMAFLGLGGQLDR